jgi:hypothetical protein
MYLKESWVIKVNLLKISRTPRVIVVAIVLAVLAGNIPAASAANKTITCYKGTLVKKVTAAKPKCATGWSTKKPVAIVKSSTVAFSGAYSGKISLLWGDGFVQAPTITGTGTGNVLGMTDLTGSGSAAPASQCDLFAASGTIGGGGNTLKVVFDTTAKGCAAEDSAPTTIKITGNAIVKGGTGKYVGATGTLKVDGSFGIKSSAAGSTESSTFKINVVGTIATK